MTDRGAVSAGLLYGSSVAVLLVARSWQQKRATGSSGFRGFTGMRSGKADRVGELSFGVAVSAGLVSPILAAAGRLPLQSRSQGTVWAGGAAAASGIVLASMAQQTMGESWRIGVDRRRRGPPHHRRRNEPVKDRDADGTSAGDESGPSRGHQLRRLVNLR